MKKEHLGHGKDKKQKGNGMWKKMTRKQGHLGKLKQANEVEVGSKRIGKLERLGNRGRKIAKEAP